MNQQQPESLKRKRIDLAQQYHMEKKPFVVKPISRSLLAEFDAVASPEVVKPCASKAKVNANRDRKMKTGETYASFIQSILNTPPVK